MLKNSIINNYTEMVEQVVETAPPMEDRFLQIELLNNMFYDETGENLPSYLLERLGTWVLKETYEDKRINKASIEEFPVLSENQLIRRKRKMVNVENEYTLDTLSYHLKNNSVVKSEDERRVSYE